MFHFYATWKCEKTLVFWYFLGDKKWNIGLKWVKIWKNKVPRKFGNTKRILKNKVPKKKNTKTYTKCQKVTRLIISFNKQSKDPIIFAGHVIITRINGVSDYLSMKNITLSQRNCIIQLNHLMKNWIYVEHAMDIVVKMKFHVRQSTKMSWQIKIN